ncbi:MAG: hypothetical protein SFZ02_14500 [bacterium]|nr:hypothetical protein [bacterium]
MRLLVVLFLVIITLVAPRPTLAAEGIGSIVVFAENGVGCDDAALRFFFSYIPSTDDFNTQYDWVDVALYDASGVMLAYNAYSANFTGGNVARIGTFSMTFNALGNTPTIRPFYLSFRESNHNTTSADFADLTELVRYPFDPVAIGATLCDNLPYAPLGIGMEDGRVNWEDNAQTAAVYCEADGSITLVAISQDTGRGLYALRASAREIARAGIPDTDPILLKQDMREEMRLYRLSSGEFQVVAPYTDAVQGTLPNGYSFLWTGCEAPKAGTTK